jgi:hypothetical protein
MEGVLVFIILHEANFQIINPKGSGQIIKFSYLWNLKITLKRI